jgi:hypothetical protein
MRRQLRTKLHGILSRAYLRAGRTRTASQAIKRRRRDVPGAEKGAPAEEFTNQMTLFKVVVDEALISPSGMHPPYPNLFGPPTGLIAPIVGSLEMSLLNFHPRDSVIFVLGKHLPHTYSIV